MSTMTFEKTFHVTALHVAIDERVAELGLEGNKSKAAKRIGVSRQVYDGWLAGRMPKLQGPDSVQRKLALFLGISPLKVLDLAGYDTTDEFDEVELSSGVSGGYLTPISTAA